MKILDKKNKIYLLDEENFNFPTLDMMKDDLVAVGGDFHPQRLLNAYENGIFPWYIDEYNYIHWFSPQKRMIIKPEEMKVSKSLKKSFSNSSILLFNCKIISTLAKFTPKSLVKVKTYLM